MNTSQSETLAIGPLNLPKGGGMGGGMSECTDAVGPGGAMLSLPLSVSPRGGERRATPLTKMPFPMTTLAAQPATIVYASWRAVDIARRVHSVRNSPCKL